jgi:hypothetical protein
MGFLMSQLSGPVLARRTLCAAAVALLVPLLPGAAQGPAFDEREVKAVFLFNFVQFVEWPETAFAAPDSPVVIGIVGDDPFGAVLDDVVRGELVRGRPLAVVRFRRQDDARGSHILFVSPSESARYERILSALGTQPTLTVGETANFTRRGMVRFVTERSRVRLEVNVAAVKAAGLTISSNLLRAARIVGGAQG